ncbi:MAG TPA: hypothetical protein VF817_00025 [Patescibacteria group bacterium]
MFFHSKVFLLSLIFFVFLESTSSDSASMALGSAFSNHFWLGLVTIAVLGVYFYQVAKDISQKSSMTPMPVLFALSTFGLLYFVQSQIESAILAVLSALAYYFIHIALYRLRSYSKDKTAHGIIGAGAVATIFLFYAMALGIYLNFAISLWILMIVLMSVTVLVSFQYLWLLNEDTKKVFSYSLVLGLVMGEIVWVVNFWPFGYLTSAAVTLIFYYVFWDLVQGHFSDNLSKRRVVSNLIVFSILSAIVLASSPWLPVV